MKRSIKLAVAAAVALSTTSAFATNGDHLIGLGAKARGMGGIGIGMSHGAESSLANPAMITSVEGTEVSFGGTIFMPDVSYDGGAGYISSSADLSVIPEVAIASKGSDNFYWGIGMFGTAGMGTDYRDDATGSTMNMVTNLQLMQFAVPLAYKANGFSIGIAPVLQYGSLDINYIHPMDGTTVGAGVAQDLGFGYNIGAAFEANGLTVGASYKSSIEMTYDGQLASATAPFVAMSVFPAAMADDLEQPAELGVGASYTMGGNTIAIDYKRIKWSDAKGYKDFGWDDQDVIIVGYQYAQDNWALRAGYNHGSSPISEQAFGPTGAGAAMNMFNLLGFPATVEDHYTVGGSYAFSNRVSADLAYTYAAEAEDSYANVMGGTSSVKHSQNGVSMQLNYNF